MTDRATVRLLLVLGLLPVLLTPACAPPPEPAAAPDAAVAPAVDDPHSHARPWEVAVEHLALDLAVDFERRVLSGRASLDVDNRAGADTLVLDTRGLTIERVTLDGGEETSFELGEEDPLLGRPLTIALRPGTQVVHVDYATGAGADAVQWLAPEQTAGGEHPFLFTQSQAILARTWVPLQDTPSVRFTYDATVRVPRGLMAVMSAENPTGTSADGVYRFAMPQPIPSYLMALAVGDLAFRAIDERTGVYAEPSVVEAAAWEFAETAEMIDAAEALYGPYRWGRYDLLVLPPSFPFGGMENPRLTFATPTILAGDRSLVALVAHELGHSWSGNLATNATWNDFWLNEGFTVYVERRLMEALRGREYAEMLASLGRGDLEATLDELGRGDGSTALHLDLAGDDPDEGMTDVAYEKGYFFLRMLEEAVGRERWDPFLRAWFDDHAFESVTSEEWLDYLRAELLAPADIDPESLHLRQWVYEPGLPVNMPRVETERFAAVDAQAERWLAGELEATALDPTDWTTHEWLHFVRGLPDDLTAERLAALDAAFGLTESGNSEILAAWFVRTIAADYEPAYPALERFLTGMGRRKFLTPLYGALAETPEGRVRALAIYEKARPGYHPLAQSSIDELLDVSEPEEGGDS
jgi:leukotriene-A4 hydrolase